ncbi:hypothetical protein [Okeania sp. SIO1I7]|uniref:hypothetical protein n=1 Tax=Okeania sp. SIO1I7 TaxID=2607772 RepID=UPI0013F7F734|nr:hypothetical protein [Okeania sp. SIO1I7]NET29164.1 hypothetical protein [Okeania sp. SIO1I7]
MESLFALCRRQETGDNRLLTPPNPPLAPPPPRRGGEDNPPLTPPRRGRTGNERGGRSGRFVSQFFCHNHPKILAFCSSFHRKVGTFFQL